MVTHSSCRVLERAQALQALRLVLALPGRAASLPWHGARLYGAAVPGDRGDAVRRFSAAASLDRGGQFNAAPYCLARAARTQAALVTFRTPGRQWISVQAA